MPLMPEPVEVFVRTDPDVARVVHLSLRFAAQLELDPRASSRVATAASELARNIVNHATAGRVRVEVVEVSGVAGVQIEAVDSGPGISDLDRSLRDHHSTGGTLGLGLPGVRRLMDAFDIESVPGEGTRVFATLWRR